MLVLWCKYRAGGGGYTENLQSAGSQWVKGCCETALGTHGNGQNNSKHIVSAPFSSRQSFFQQGTNRSRLEKDIEKKEKGVDGHKRTSQIFSSGRLGFWLNNAVHVKTETFHGNMGMSRAFYFGKGKPPEAFKEDGILQSGFYYYYFKISTVSFKNAMFYCFSFTSG